MDNRENIKKIAMFYFCPTKNVFDLCEVCAFSTIQSVLQLSLSPNK